MYGIQTAPTIGAVTVYPYDTKFKINYRQLVPNALNFHIYLPTSFMNQKNKRGLFGIIAVVTVVTVGFLLVNTVIQQQLTPDTTSATNSASYPFLTFTTNATTAFKAEDNISVQVYAEVSAADRGEMSAATIEGTIDPEFFEIDEIKKTLGSNFLYVNNKNDEGEFSIDIAAQGSGSFLPGQLIAEILLTVKKPTENFDKSIIYTSKFLQSSGYTRENIKLPVAALVNDQVELLKIVEYSQSSIRVTTNQQVQVGSEGFKEGLSCTYTPTAWSECNSDTQIRGIASVSGAECSEKLIRATMPNAFVRPCGNLKPTVSMRSSSTEVAPGQPINISWILENTSFCRIETIVDGTQSSSNILLVRTSGSTEFTAPQNANQVTYKLVCNTEQGRIDRELVIQLNGNIPDPQAPEVLIQIDKPNTLATPDTFTVSWTTSDADTCELTTRISDTNNKQLTSETETVETNGTKTINLFEKDNNRNIEFAIGCENAVGSATDQLTLKVVPSSNSNAAEVTLISDSLGSTPASVTPLEYRLSWGSVKVESCTLLTKVSAIESGQMLQIIPNIAGTEQVATNGNKLVKVDSVSIPARISHMLSCKEQGSTTSVTDQFDVVVTPAQSELDLSLIDSTGTKIVDSANVKTPFAYKLNWQSVHVNNCKLSISYLGSASGEVPVIEPDLQRQDEAIATNGVSESLIINTLSEKTRIINKIECDNIGGIGRTSATAEVTISPPTVGPTVNMKLNGNEIGGNIPAESTYKVSWESTQSETCSLQRQVTPFPSISYLSDTDPILETSYDVATSGEKEFTLGRISGSYYLNHVITCQGEGGKTADRVTATAFYSKTTDLTEIQEGSLCSNEGGISVGKCGTFNCAPNQIPVFACENSTIKVNCAGSSSCADITRRACPKNIAFVCGVNGITYNNSCEAEVQGISIAYRGSCRTTVDSTYCKSQYNPVCGMNGISYPSSCIASISGIPIAYKGKCTTTPVCKTPDRWCDPRITDNVEDTDDTSLACKADFNNSGKLDIIDFGKFALTYRKPLANCAQDITGGDCKYTIEDLSIFAKYFNQSDTCNTSE